MRTKERGLLYGKGKSFNQEAEKASKKTQKKENYIWT